MKKFLSKALSIIVFLAMVLPSTGTVSASGLLYKPVNNAAGTPDTITVTGLLVGDIVKVYSVGGTVLATATAKADKAIKGATITATAVVSIEQLGTGTGTVDVSVKSIGHPESAKVSVSYDAEAMSPVTVGADVSIVNNAAGTPDTVTVTNLQAGDIIKVYSDYYITGNRVVGTIVGRATAKAVKGETAISATANIAQLGSIAGYVYVSVIRPGYLEYTHPTASDPNEGPLLVNYDAEQRSTQLDIKNIIPTNNAFGTPDTIEVDNLAVGDVIKVLSRIDGTVLGTATAKAIKGSSATAIVSIAQLPQIPQGTDSVPSVDVTLASKGYRDSFPTKVTYSNELQTVISDSMQVSIINNALGTPDTVTVTGLAVGDIIKVYSDVTTGAAIGTATAKADKSAGTIGATASIPQLGADAGHVFVSVTSKGFLESRRAGEYTYNAESRTSRLDYRDIKQTEDSVIVTNIQAGDVVKVYSSYQLNTNGVIQSQAVLEAAGAVYSLTGPYDGAGTILGTATAKADKVGKGELATATATIKSTQFGQGPLYVTVTKKGLLESYTAQVLYVIPVSSDAPVLHDN